MIAPFDPFAGPPRLNGARRVGLRPGTEVIHPIAATGIRPLHFAVSGLPPGIDVDEQGILRGTAPATAGDHPLTVQVSTGLGTIEATLELRVGDTLALTPPDAAELTCGGCFGGYGYEDVDARAYAAWGVDLLLSLIHISEPTRPTT